MLRKSLNASAAAAAIALSLTACGGGGGGSSALPSTGAPTTTTPTQSQSAKATMTIKIPAKTLASSSKAQYISASTQSMTIGLVGSDKKTTQLAEVDLTASSKNCSALAGGGLQCNVVFVGPAGKDELFALSMYDKTGGNGNALSTGQVVATLAAGQNTSIPIALDGVPATVTAALSPSTLQVGTPGSAIVVIEARDSDHNVIVGPGGYSSPITLAISGDTYHTLTLATTPSGSATPPPGPPAVTSPGQLVTLQYNGGTNVGSTITPSIGGKAGTAATFAGAGGAITYIAPTLTDGGSTLYPYSIATLPNGSAAFLIGRSYTCCPPKFFGAIGTTTASGAQSYFVGDTSDPFNPGTATSHFTTGITVVPGMSVNLSIDPFTNGCCSSIQQHGLTTDANGNIYYGASFSSTAAGNGCAGGGGTLASGTIGKFDPVAKKTTETILQGTPLILQTDSAGNVWFIERSGTCNGTNLLPSGYGIGKLTASGVTEKDFTAAGITGSNPSAMSISADGSEMYIGDYSAGTITPIATASLTAQASVSLTHTIDPISLATAPDGTTLWFSNNASGYEYYYGYVPGSVHPFAGATPVEALYPIPYGEQYDTVYADGSFWGGNEENGGFQRIGGVANGKPQYQYYGPSAYYDEPAGVAADTTNGYIWGADWDYGTIMLLQYGGMSNTTTTLARSVGKASTSRNPALHKH